MSRTTGRWVSLLAVSCMGSAAPALSACIADPDPQIRQLQTMVAQNAIPALGQIQAALTRLPDSAATAQQNSAHLAALYAVQAAAYEILEMSAEARTAASLGLKLATGVHDPVHLELLSAYAENVYDEAGIKAALETIESARIAQRPESPADTCLLITRGLLEHRQDRADLAIITLSAAYRASSAPVVTEVHALSAGMLSVVMRGMGDYAQALALNQEKIDWDTAHEATLSLSVSRFMRGQILRLMGRYLDAIVEFTQARRLSVMLDDQLGIAYADLRVCEAHVELGEYAGAQRECTAAGTIFAASQSPDSVKETLALQARIDLGQGRPERALATLDGVLDQRGADMPPLNVASLYESRAHANAALHYYQNAYADLEEYVQRYVAADRAEHRRQAGALRARFETDREIERNASLKHELTASQEQSRRQARELRWNAIVAITGVGVIALLVYFLVANHRYRKRLVKYASQDGLTGLPNRRRIAELATAALGNATARQRPLTVAIIDMDHFKVINDCCGHATGDLVLKEFARAGLETLRECDSLGRWGGEEFLLVMPDATLEVAVANLERLRTRVFAIRLPPSGAGIRVSMSAGLAVADADVRSLDELIARADEALYAAKSEGRDQVRVANEGLVTGAHAVRRAAR